MGRRFSVDDLARIYAKHPLRADTIAARLKRQGRSLSGLREFDLAHDPDSHVTDQNHLGGAAATRRLAELAGVTRESAVLDACSGLGGTARVLAEHYSCAVDAIELTPQRHRDAVYLTSLVGLESLVRHIEGDLLTYPLAHEAYDVIITQSALVHFSEQCAVLKRCRDLLRERGTLAFEEECLRRPVPAAWETAVGQLEELWCSYLIPSENWRANLELAGFEIRIEDDLSADHRAHFARMLSGHACAGRSTVHPDERLAWKLAVELSDVGLLGYKRFVAVAKPKARSGSSAESV
jgi:SAM-dependent methyltransferase